MSSPNRKKKKYNFSSRKAKFTRERDRSSSPSDDEAVPTRQPRIFQATSPNQKMLRAARRSKEPPTCLIYGPFRETLYPDHFFCHPCKMYEDQLLSGSLHRLASRNSRRYKCIAKHTDYCFPTQLHKQCKINTVAAAKPSSSDDIESVVLSSSDAVGEGFILESDELLDDFRTLQEAFYGCQEKIDALQQSHASYVMSLKEEMKVELENEKTKMAQFVNEQNKTIEELKTKIKSLSSHLNYYKKKAEEEKLKDAAKVASVPLTDAIVAAVNNLMNSKQRYKLLSPKNKAAAVARAVFHPNFAHGIAFEDIISHSKKWLRDNVFKPSEILKQMDLRGGTLNYEGITVLNDVEASAYTGTGKRFRGRLICTPACLQRVAKELEKEADTLCPFKRIETPFGEGIEFNYARVTRLVLNAFGLSRTAAQRSINISGSIDAARVTKNICHTSAGLKMTDVEGKDPLKRCGTFITDENSLRDLQSQNTVFLLKIVLTKETKESFKLFDDVFQFFRLSSLNPDEREHDPKNDPKYEWELLNDLKPLNVTMTTDMAADWKLVGAGGGVKQTEMFCNLCTCASNDVHQPHAEKCDRFCSQHQDDPDWVCYHHPIFCNNEYRERFHQEVEELKQRLHASLEELNRQSKIRLHTNPTRNVQTLSKTSIGFIPTNGDEKDSFIDLLINELLLRGLNPTGELDELRERLRPELHLENKLRQHLKKLEHCTKLEASLIALLHKIPCILHCENRVGLKILFMLLQEGFCNVKNGTLFPHIRGENNRILAYAQEIERILNNNILGDEDGPAQWVLPMDKDNKSVGIICLDNNRIRKILNAFETLVAASITDDSRVVKYNTSVSNYRTGMVILRQRQNYSDEDVKLFQRHMDIWFQIWNKLHSQEGCTNYTHMLSSGHIAEYKCKWRNMYRFSQQGWEKFNHIFSTVYFRRTNHGGRRHGNTIKSKLVGIGRWLQRRLLWMTGLADDILAPHTDDSNNDQGNDIASDDDEI